MLIEDTFKYSKCALIVFLFSFSAKLNLFTSATKSALLVKVDEYLATFEFNKDFFERLNNL